MRSIVLIAGLCAGCVRDVMPDLPEAQESVATLVLPDPAPTRIDLLFVIDNSPAMQPHVPALADAMRAAGFELQRAQVDLNVGVITTDLGAEQDLAQLPMPGQCAGWGDAAAFRRSVLVDGSYIHYRFVRDEMSSNVASTVPEALGALGAVGAGGCAQPRPLEAMRIALDHDPHDGGFLRDNAQLSIVIVAGKDDASPRSIDDYAAFLHRLRPNVAVQIEGGPAQSDCGDLPTARLRAFSQLFPNRGGFSSICGLADGGLASLGLSYFLPGWGPIIGTPCFDQPLVDTDGQTPGVQPECTVTEYIDRGRADEQQHLLAACGGGAPACWRLVEDAQCGAAQHLRLEIDRGGEDPPDNTIVEAQCVSS